MKRYLAFFGSKYYPVGGMADFIGDFDTDSEAIQCCSDAAMKDSQLWRFTWANVWDSDTRKTVWKSPVN